MGTSLFSISVIAAGHFMIQSSRWLQFCSVGVSLLEVTLMFFLWLLCGDVLLGMMRGSKVNENVQLNHSFSFAIHLELLPLRASTARVN